MFEFTRRAEYAGIPGWTRRKYIHVGSLQPSMAADGPARNTRTLRASNEFEIRLPTGLGMVGRSVNVSPTESLCCNEFVWGSLYFTVEP